MTPPADPRSRAGRHAGRQRPASRRRAPRRAGDRRRVRALPRRADRGGRRDARPRRCSAGRGGAASGAGDLEEIDGRGLSAIPGLVDCHTHACFGGDRVNEFSLRAGGASYEELHAAGGGILSTVRATRAAGEAELTAITARHRSWMRAHGTTTFEGKSGYGLDHDTELAQLRAVRAAGGVPTWLGAHTVPPEFDDGDAYIDFLLAEVLPEAAAARGGGRRLPRARLVRRPTSPAATSRHAATQGSRSACTATSSRSRARSGSRSSSGRDRSITSRRPGRTASRSSPRAT